MDMSMVYMGSQNVLIFVIEKCLAKLLPDEDRPFGSALGVHLCEAEAPTEATAETQIFDLRICKAL